jgi:hypothetical protein
MVTAQGNRMLVSTIKYMNRQGPDSLDLAGLGTSVLVLSLLKKPAAWSQARTRLR